MPKGFVGFSQALDTFGSNPPCVSTLHFFLLPLAALCDRALPAADFDAALVRPSRRTFEAARAADAEVTFFGAFLCESALPAARLDVALADLLRRVFDAFEAALRLVTFDVLAIESTPFEGGKLTPED